MKQHPHSLVDSLTLRMNYEIFYLKLMKNIKKLDKLTTIFFISCEKSRIPLNAVHTNFFKGGVVIWQFLGALFYSLNIFISCETFQIPLKVVTRIFLNGEVVIWHFWFHPNSRGNFCKFVGYQYSLFRCNPPFRRI